MSSKIILLLTLATTMLACPALAMKEIQIQFRNGIETYEINDNTCNQIGFLNYPLEVYDENEDENTDFGIKKLLDETRPGTTENEFTKHIELTKISSKEKKEEKPETQTLVNKLTDKKFIAQTQLTHILKNEALEPLFGNRLQWIIKKHGEEYCLHKEGPLKEVIEQLPFDFCNQAVRKLPSSYLPPLKTFNGHKKRVRSVVKINKDQVISTSSDNTLKLWDLNTGNCLKTLIGHKKSVNSVVKMNDHQAISASFDNNLKLWDLITGNCLKTLIGHTGWVISVVKINKNRVISTSSDNTLKLWDLITGNCLKTLTGHTGCVISVKKINDHLVISTSWDKTLRLWDLSTGNCLKIFTGHTQGVTSVKKINENQVISTSWDNTLKLWDLITGTCLKTFTGHTQGIIFVKKINDHLVISASSDQTLKLWDLKTGNCLKTLIGHKGSVCSVVKINENLVISTSSDSTMKLWDLKTGNCLKTFTGHTDWVRSVVKINENLIISTSSDSTMKLWDLNCLQQLTFEQALFLKTLKPFPKKINGKKLILTNYPRAYKIFCELPKDIQKWAIKNNLVHLPVTTKIWNFVKDHPKTFALFTGQGTVGLLSSWFNEN